MKQEYQDYMDKLMEQWRMISDKIAPAATPGRPSSI